MARTAIDVVTFGFAEGVNLRLITSGNRPPPRVSGRHMGQHGQTNRRLNIVWGVLPSDFFYGVLPLIAALTGAIFCTLIDAKPAHPSQPFRQIGIVGSDTAAIA